jgi:RNA polymerase sigma-70 factor (ECF subfamily)
VIDEERFAALVERERDALLGYALRRVPDPADAADVVAETLLVAWRRGGDIPPGDRARPWLFGVARKVLLNQQRCERRRLALADRLRSHLELGPVPGSEDSALDGAMQRLPEPDRELLRLLAWEELDAGAIAAVLGVPRGTVRVRLHRARRRLRAALDDERSAGHRSVTPLTPEESTS